MRRTVVLTTPGKSRDHDYGDCIDVLKHQLGLLVLETRRHPQLDMARSSLACAALDQGADVAFFIDSDITFDPPDVERLADVARETRGVVGAPYSIRGMGAGVIGGIDPDVGDVVFFEGGGLYPATGIIGMGFTAIHADAFARLDRLPEYAPRQSPGGLLRPYFQKLVVDGYWHHEDASFCHAVRQAGGTTHVATRFRVRHVGDHPFCIEDASRRDWERPTITYRVKTDWEQRTFPAKK